MVSNFSTLGEAWIYLMNMIMIEGRSIKDDNLELKEICNVNISIDSIDISDPIIKEYADMDRIKLMKKICYMWFSW